MPWPRCMTPAGLPMPSQWCRSVLANPCPGRTTAPTSCTQAWWHRPTAAQLAGAQEGLRTGGGRAWHAAHPGCICATHHRPAARRFAGRCRAVARARQLARRGGVHAGAVLCVGRGGGHSRGQARAQARSVGGGGGTRSSAVPCIALAHGPLPPMPAGGRYVFLEHVAASRGTWCAEPATPPPASLGSLGSRRAACVPEPWILTCCWWTWGGQARQDPGSWTAGLLA